METAAHECQGGWGYKYVSVLDVYTTLQDIDAEGVAIDHVAEFLWQAE
jgi:hypothetical protein